MTIYLCDYEIEITKKNASIKFDAEIIKNERIQHVIDTILDYVEESENFSLIELSKLTIRLDHSKKVRADFKIPKNLEKYMNLEEFIISGRNNRMHQKYLGDLRERFGVEATPERIVVQRVPRFIRIGD